MKYIGGRIRLTLNSRKTFDNDMEMYRRLKAVSKELVEKYGVEINLEHEPFYENTHEIIRREVEEC